MNTNILTVLILCLIPLCAFGTTSSFKDCGKAWFLRGGGGGFSVFFQAGTRVVGGGGGGSLGSHVNTVNRANQGNFDTCLLSTLPL